jgi:hypothetical protein
MNTAIIGAGAAGLSLGMMLEGDFTIFEKENVAGGLCRSIRHELGYTFDQGPHILGGIPDAVDWIINHTSVTFLPGETNNMAWTEANGWLRHPLQNESLGYEYMKKMWKTEPEELSGFGLNVQKDRKPGGVAKFWYPKFGGYQSITDDWAEQLKDHIEYEYNVVKNYDTLAAFDRIVWTAPSVLRYNDLHIQTAVFGGEPPDLTAIYLPDENISFHRLSFPCAFSKFNAPEGEYLVQGEYSLNNKAGFLAPDLHLLDLCKKLGMDGSCRLLDRRTIKNAYPVPLKENPPVESTGRWFNHGRTGSHSYLNIDGVVKQSMLLAEKLNPVRMSYGPGDDLA